MFVGDGSYLMLNSDLYSSVLSGHKMIVVALRQRRIRGDRAPAGRPGRRAVQQPVDRRPHARGATVRVDFAGHAAALGCEVASRRRRSTSWARPSTGPGRPTAPRSSSSTPTRTPGPKVVRGGRSGFPRRPIGRRSARPARRWTWPRRSSAEGCRVLQDRPARLRTDRSDARRAVELDGSAGSQIAKRLRRRPRGRRAPGRRATTSTSPRRSTRRSTGVDARGHLHEHRHARRADHRAPPRPASPRSARSRSRSICRRSTPRSPPSTRRARTCRSASTAASIRPTRRSGRPSPTGRWERCASSRSPAVTGCRRRSPTWPVPAGCSST